VYWIVIDWLWIVSFYARREFFSVISAPSPKDKIQHLQPEIFNLQPEVVGTAYVFVFGLLHALFLLDHLRSQHLEEERSPFWSHVPRTAIIVFSHHIGGYALAERVRQDFLGPIKKNQIAGVDAIDRFSRHLIRIIR
jgi:hypothetical protein